MWWLVFNNPKACTGGVQVPACEFSAGKTRYGAQMSDD
jgi:hypothetical protein